MKINGTPFNFVVSEHVMPGTLMLVNPRYKTVRVGTGEPSETETLLDLEETAKASVVIYNIGVKGEGNA